MHKCSDVMTKDPHCCLPHDTVGKLAQLMGKKDIGPVLIVEDEKTKKLAGIVTDRDLTLKIVAEGRDPKTTKAEEVMTRKVVTVYADDDVQKALDLMAKHQIRRIPVLDAGNKLVGILAQADVATRVDKPEKTAAVVKGISQAHSAAEQQGAKSWG
jgi:CBS domain-containing protein